MHLMYHEENGTRVYTLKVSMRSSSGTSGILTHATLQKKTPTGEMTKSAHPARFSPDDK